MPWWSLKGLAVSSGVLIRRFQKLQHQIKVVVLLNQPFLTFLFHSYYLIGLIDQLWIMSVRAPVAHQRALDTLRT